MKAMISLESTGVMKPSSKVIAPGLIFIRTWNVEEIFYKLMPMLRGFRPMLSERPPELLLSEKRYE